MSTNLKTERSILIPPHITDDAVIQTIKKAAKLVPHWSLQKIDESYRDAIEVEIGSWVAVDSSDDAPYINSTTIAMIGLVPLGALDRAAQTVVTRLWDSNPSCAAPKRGELANG